MCVPEPLVRYQQREDHDGSGQRQRGDGDVPAIVSMHH